MHWLEQGLLTIGRSRVQFDPGVNVMTVSVRVFVCGMLVLLITSRAAADDRLESLRKSVLQVLDDPKLGEAERFRVLRTVLDAGEAAMLTENSKEWVSALRSDKFDIRHEAREQLTQAGELALSALEDGARSSDLEVSTSCLQLIGRLARSDEHPEGAMYSLERLAKDGNESTAARASNVLTSAKQFHEQRVIQAAIDRLIGVGCRISYDERSPGKPVNRISISGGGGFNDDVMTCIAAFPKLESLHLHRANITDAGMVHLAGLRSLRRLALSHSSISDKGLVHIAELTGLESLAIDDTQVSDDGLQYLMKLSNLEDLRLSGTRVTDNGLVHLKNLQKLTALGLGLRGKVTDDGLRVLQEFPLLTRLTLASDFSDRGVKHLAGITNLERLSFISCKGFTDAGLKVLSNMKTLKHLSIYSASDGITEAGIAELRNALPGLDIGGMR